LSVKAEANLFSRVARIFKSYANSVGECSRPLQLAAAGRAVLVAARKRCSATAAI
jgi:hypothetical protein